MPDDDSSSHPLHHHLPQQQQQQQHPQQQQDHSKPSLHNVRVALPHGTVHSLNLDPSATLATIVDHIVRAESLDLTTVRLRLIVAGKLYTDHSLPVTRIVPPGGFIHCAISHRPPPPPPTASNSSSLPDARRSPASRPPNARVPHITIPIDAYNVDGEVRIVIPYLNSQTAFNRLSDAGFTSDEIRFIRRYVRALQREARLRYPQPVRVPPSDSNTTAANPSNTEADGHTSTDNQMGQPTQQPSNGDTEQRTVTAADEDHIQSGDRSRERELEYAPDADPITTNITIRPRALHRNPIFSSGVDGTNADFLMGCIFGYLLGIIVLALLLDNNTTRRWRIGTIAGVATNCAFGVLRTSISFNPLATP